jgi:hypothetical protein
VHADVKGMRLVGTGQSSSNLLLDLDFLPARCTAAGSTDDVDSAVRYTLFFSFHVILCGFHIEPAWGYFFFLFKGLCMKCLTIEHSNHWKTSS